MIEYSVIQLVGKRLYTFTCENCGMTWQIWDLDLKAQKYMTCCRCAICEEIDTDGHSIVERVNA